MTKDGIYEELGKMFGYPCNYSPIHEYILNFSRCDELCPLRNPAVCWKKYFDLNIILIPEEEKLP